MALENGSAIVLSSYGIVPARECTARLIKITEKKLRVGVVLGSGRKKPIESKVIIGRIGIFRAEELAKLFLSDRIAGCGARYKSKYGSCGPVLGLESPGTKKTTAAIRRVRRNQFHLISLLLVSKANSTDAPVTRCSDVQLRAISSEQLQTCASP